jgi:KDO2-lipid IV(A) lauroyltransferase
MSAKTFWLTSAPVQWSMYVLFRAVIMVVSMFRPSWVRRIGRLVGKLFYLVDVKHRPLAEKNVLRAEGMTRDPREAKRFVRRCYEHIGLSIVENLMLPRMFANRQIAGLVDVGELRRLADLLGEGRGAIVVIAHLGNWELGGIAAAMTGLPLHSIARPVANPWFDEYLARFRTSTGQAIIPKSGAVAEAREVLKRNEVLVVLADQDARRSGVFVPFFGRPASTIRTPALLFLKYRAPIVPVDIHREGRERHVIRVAEPIRPGDYESIDEGVTALTAAFTARLEAFIRAHPEQWMWLHARWKTKPDPEGEPVDRREMQATA